MSTQLSITRALATIKSLNARINKLSKGQVIILPTAGTGEDLVIINNSGLTKEKAEAMIKSNWDELQNTIKVRDDIRSAVTQSNAVTKIEVGGKSYTVVQAIDAKKNLVDKKALLDQLKKNIISTNNQYQAQSTAHQKQLGQVRTEALANGKNHTEEALKVYTNPVDLRMAPGLVDPLSATELVAKLEDEISDFELNVDYALSESNALTKITIESGNLKL